MNDYQFIEQKLNNFKLFLKDISKNQETIAEYENMGMNKLMLFVNFFLRPQKDNLDFIADSMREKLNYDIEHNEKIKKYLMMFIELTDGTPTENIKMVIEKDKEKVEIPDKKPDETIDEYLLKLEQLAKN